MRKSYPEVGVIRNPSHPASWGSQGSAQFPERCPCCGAKRVAQDESADVYVQFAVYSCGGAYVPKPQIQTHTHVYWGSCPASNMIETIK